MLFNSFDFLIFFIIITSLYFCFPHKYRWFILLSASCYFYMAFVPIYILILGFTIFIDYYAAILIENTVNNKYKKVYLISSLVANIGVLVVFKYFNFLNENITFLLNQFQIQNNIPYLKILLPIGLSFHTFQAMSYTIEVFRGNQQAERHFGLYSLYVMFYPQLVAGPIERPQNILHQFKIKQKINQENLVLGLQKILWGLFKKVVIADRLAIVVDIVFDHPTSYNSISLFVASLFFTYQIYCDFSGYSDIAIGTARVMGIDLMSNFNLPYRSTSIQQFWKKWHISLSTWFRDYLYIPLGGNRVSFQKLCLNTILIFLISGIWHGANWTFVVWGALHGAMLIVEIVFRKYLVKMNINLYSTKSLRVIITFLFVNFTWVFFRAKNLNLALEFIVRFIVKLPNLIYEILQNGKIIENLGVSTNILYYSISLIVLLETLNHFSRKRNFNHFHPFIKFSTYILASLMILLLGVFKQNQFIYFQF